MSAAAVLRWQGGALVPSDAVDAAPGARAPRLDAADSWLVDDRGVLALDLHRERFLAAVPTSHAPLDPWGFWEAAVASLPRDGAWFPRVEARTAEAPDGSPAPELLLRTRPAPELRRSVRLATHAGADPRTAPTVKGPDLEAMLRLRAAAEERGADEAVLLEPDGAVAEGSTSCLVWWRGDALALPSPEIERIDSVTVRAVVGLAGVLGVDVVHERATPDDLDGCEVWACSALHGPRIVTAWVDGPATAELPGRLELWRRRLTALRKPPPVS